MNLTNLVLSQWLYERFVIGGIVGITAFSIILLAGRLTDGISDPFIAYWTDISYTRWGRRIPFLVCATLPLAIVCFLLWCPPEKAPDTIRIIYAAAVCQGYFLRYGLVVTPYLALLPELGNSPRERLNLTTGQGVATLAGTLVFALSGLIIQKFGYPALGVVLGSGGVNFVLSNYDFYPRASVRRTYKRVARRFVSLDLGSAYESRFFAIANRNVFLLVRFEPIVDVGAQMGRGAPGPIQRRCDLVDAPFYCRQPGRLFLF